MNRIVASSPGAGPARQGQPRGSRFIPGPKAGRPAGRRRRFGVLPGFGLSMGYAVLYLSLLVLIPLVTLP
ncbi:MAG: hypothetical protein AB7E55_18560, partial [Pigmentiphaga sp.]